MPAQLAHIDNTALAHLRQLGKQVRLQRKALRVSATAAAEAAGMSRVTWHRIEKGEPSVTMGAYLNAMAALGLELRLFDPSAPTLPTGSGSPEPSLPVRIRLSRYPQLKQLAWQVHGVDELTPREALDIYERNQRHLDVAALDPSERDLLKALRLVLAGEPQDV